MAGASTSPTSSPPIITTPATTPPRPSTRTGAAPPPAPTLPINWQAGARFARLNYLIAREIADGATAPLWYQGSFFGDAFGGNQPRAPQPAAAMAAGAH